MVEVGLPGTTQGAISARPIDPIRLRFAALGRRTQLYSYILDTDVTFARTIEKMAGKTDWKAIGTEIQAHGVTVSQGSKRRPGWAVRSTWAQVCAPEPETQVIAQCSKSSAYTYLRSIDSRSVLTCSLVPFRSSKSLWPAASRCSRRCLITGSANLFSNAFSTLALSSVDPGEVPLPNDCTTSP